MIERSFDFQFEMVAIWKHFPFWRFPYYHWSIVDLDANDNINNSNDNSNNKSNNKNNNSDDNNDNDNNDDHNNNNDHDSNDNNDNDNVIDNNNDNNNIITMIIRFDTAYPFPKLQRLHR